MPLGAELLSRRTRESTLSQDPGNTPKKDVKRITLLWIGATILDIMLIPFAFARIVPAEVEQDDLDDEPRAALGHLGFTIITLVFMLLTFWKS